MNGQNRKTIVTRNVMWPNGLTIDYIQKATLLDLHVYHLSRQPITASRCGDNNGGCSYLCLPRPQEDSKMSYECACPNGMKFGTGEKQHQCIPSDENINIPKPNTEDTSSNANIADYLSLSRKVPGVIALIVIATLLLIGIATVIIIFLLVEGNTRKETLKSMNFDNPVYRKTTTEDQLIMNKSESEPVLPSDLQQLTQEHEKKIVKEQFNELNRCY
ncbi:hypothetical protein Btru_018102 [Bulinus truncatus]|nr:hypothetical protein Btru_018102 [Bulinus truncatus]